MSSVSTLMLCCCSMLTSSYPVQVSVPVRPLLALVGRVLMVDGSLSQALFPFMTAMQQEFICSRLPVLHTHSLYLLTAIIKGVRSQLLPHAAEIVRLLTEYFRTCALPELRIKIYSILRILLISMGVGVAVYLAQEVINNASVDLEKNDGTSSGAYPKASAEALLQPSRRKRKHITTTGFLEKEQHDTVGSEVGVPNKYPTTPTSVKIAALEALEALLTLQQTLVKGDGPMRKQTFFCPTKIPPLGQISSLYPYAHFWHPFFLQLVYAPHILPRVLSSSVEASKKREQRLAEFCAHALMALEVLIHPRARSLGDFPSANHNSFDVVNLKFPENIYSGSQKHNISSGTLGMRLGDPNPDDDDLYDSWLGNGDEIEVPVTDLGKNTNNADSISDPSAEKLLSVDVSSITKNLKESKQGPAAASVVGMGGNLDEIMVESQQFHEPISHVGAVVPAISGSRDAEIELGRVTGSGALDPMDSEPASGKDILVTKGEDQFATVGENTCTTMSNLVKSKDVGHAFCNVLRL